MQKNKSNIIVYVLGALLFVAGIGGAYYVGKLKAENKALSEVVGSKDSDSLTKNEKTENKEPDSKELARNMPPISKKDHIRGNPEATIAMVEYSDYQCSYCMSFHETAKQVIEKNNDVMWVYRHFPLDAIHPKARLAAKASECVAELGGNESFWTFSDSLFENQSKINEEKIDELALATGIDKTKYETCLTSDKIKGTVNDQFNNGGKAGIRGTPGVILLNTKTNQLEVLKGAEPLPNVEAAISSLLE